MEAVSILKGQVERRSPYDERRKKGISGWERKWEFYTLCGPKPRFTLRIIMNVMKCNGNKFVTDMGIEAS